MLAESTKCLLLFSNQPETLLKGLTSNNLAANKNAFLDKNGRIIAVCEQLALADGRMAMLVEKSAIPGLMGHLFASLRLSDVVLEQPDVKVYFTSSSADADASADVVGQYYFSLVSEGVAGLITSNVDLVEDGAEALTDFRLEHNIALQGIDYGAEMLLNVFPEGCVDYTKGCFVGQEIIARVHHKSSPPKALSLVWADQCAEGHQKNMTSVALTGDSGRERGFLLKKA